MMRSCARTLLTGLGLVLLGTGAAAQTPAASTLYRTHGCYQCHGLAGQGSIISGPALAGRSLSPARIIAYVRSPRGTMPPYRSAILTDGDLARIAAYVAGLPGGRSASAIPLLAKAAAAGHGRVVRKSWPPAPARANASPLVPPRPSFDGRGLYADYCSACHGAGREGGVGPDLRPERTRRSVDETLRVLINPPAGMPKFLPAPLSIDQLRAIAVFVHAPK